MALTNRQIERYSRQLITPNFGGVAQERLLAARVLLLGDYADTSVLAYLVGAGVGRIDLNADPDPSASAAIVARMRDLNPDSIVRVRPRVALARVASDRVPQDREARDRDTQDREARDIAPGDLGELDEYDLALVLVSDDATIDQARLLYEQPDNLAANFTDTSRRDVSQDFPQKLMTVFARLDQPARIAVIPRRPPCPRCATVGDLLAPVSARADNAGFVASLAALEAIKLLARFGAPPQPTLIEFRGYESSARVIDSIPVSTCSCATARSSEGSQ